MTAARPTPRGPPPLPEVLPFNPPQIRNARSWSSSEQHGTYETFGSCPFVLRGSSPADSTQVIWRNCCLVISQPTACPLHQGTGRRMNSNSICAEVTDAPRGWFRDARFVLRRALPHRHGIIKGEQAITRRAE
jgi:hypothetical protein